MIKKALKIPIFRGLWHQNVWQSRRNSVHLHYLSKGEMWSSHLWVLNSKTFTQQGSSDNDNCDR